ncbi:ribonuclease P protein component [Puia sp.]|jgi:RNase P protein component|uniref:ribonuclease P protein component n=1 Tax=Puia sp. TaxID=2045100 RepID=UPI002F42B6D6
MAQQRFTWKKAEKLKSRKRIEKVFREGKSLTVFPYKVVFLLSAATTAPAAAGVTADPNPADPAAAPVSAGSAADSMPLVFPASTVTTPHTSPAPLQWGPLQAGFGASARNFKKAVDRNRIKRLGREAYRLQKGALLEQLTAKGLSMAVFFVFIGKELPDYPTVSARIGVALQKLLKVTA